MFFNEYRLKNTLCYPPDRTGATLHVLFIIKHQDLISEGVEWGVTAEPGHIKVTFKSTSHDNLRKIMGNIETDYKEKIGDEIFQDIHVRIIESFSRVQKELLHSFPHHYNRSITSQL